MSLENIVCNSIVSNTLLTLPVQNVELFPACQKGSLVVDKTSLGLYLSNGTIWTLIAPLSALNITNEGAGEGIYDNASSNQTDKVFKSLVAGTGINITPGLSELTISTSFSQNYVSFFVDKSGTQLLDSTDLFNYIPIIGWGILGSARYNNTNGSFNEISGEFTVPFFGKYIVAGNINFQIGNPVQDIDCLCIRIAVDGETIIENRVKPFALSNTNSGINLNVYAMPMLQLDSIVTFEACFLSSISNQVEIMAFIGLSTFEIRLVEELIP
jgi:hypothetical protein